MFQTFSCIGGGRVMHALAIKRSCARLRPPVQLSLYDSGQVVHRRSSV